MTRASDFPPPYSPKEAIGTPTDPEDERIEVGVAIVGGGPAGLAAAIRLGQLLEDDPDTAERLGEVPIAVIEKGKQAGSHLLSGAVMNPRAIAKLFEGRKTLDEMPIGEPVKGERVYVLSKKGSIPIPPPPTMRNHGNRVVSLSQLGRWLAEQAEEGGAMLLPETSATKVLVADGKVVGVRTGDKGRGKEGEELGNYEPGVDLVAKVTILAEGVQGYLTEAAVDHFDLRGAAPQTWELGVKEVWRVPGGIDKIVHTMGWPLRPGAKFREFGGSFIYPMGEDLLTIGMVVGLDYRDAAISAHDLLQELKTHPLIRKILAGGERLEWGAKTISSGGFFALPKSMHAPGLLLAGEGAGFVNVPTLKGVHYAIETGRLAAESAYEALRQGEAPHALAALAGYDDAIRESYVWNDLKKVRNMRQVFSKGFYVGGALASLAQVTGGRLPGGQVASHPDAEAEIFVTDRAKHYPAPDGKLTFDKLSSVFASGNKTRDDQPNHIRVETNVPVEIAKLWTAMCPAQVYEVLEADGDSTVSVQVNPSNCVQCGAITAKGGRLTPPEGGSGPEYKNV